MQQFIECLLIADSHLPISNSFDENPNFVAFANFLFNSEYANPPLQLCNYWQGNNKTEYE